MIHAAPFRRRGPAPGTAAFTERWTAEQFAAIPRQWQGRVAKRWRAELAESEFQGNTYLRETADRLRVLRLPLSATDSDLCALADRCADEAMGRAAVALGNLGLIRAAMARFVVSQGLEPPGEETEDRPAIARMTDAHWWRRRLRKLYARTVEATAIELGYVHARGEIYCSTVGVEQRRQQKRRNRDTLADTVATNQDGEQFTLLELAERSNANPRIRRAELMTRIAGFERVADALGHVAEFVTMTAPSRFHAVRSKGGERNARHDGSTPRDAQQHLVKAWARCRAALNRRGIRPYGFRIAEPHHDGCPHWHCLFFVPKWLDAGRRVVPRLRVLIRRYFLRQHDASERGARENRVKFVAIEPGQGTAAGYVAKYVAKNIDGYQVGEDLFGNPAIETSERVDAWASRWGIRQFQQVGGAPVGVWRELRRLEEDAEHSGCMAAARAAADAGDWQAYVMRMGGPTVERKALPLAVAYTRQGERWNPQAGCPEPAPANRYGDLAAPAVFGVADRRKGRAFVSRLNRWEISRRAGDVRGYGSGMAAVVAGGRRGVGGLLGVGEDSAGGDVGFQAGIAGPWTRVNNCTGRECGGRSESAAGGDSRSAAGAAGRSGCAGPVLFPGSGQGAGRSEEDGSLDPLHGGRAGGPPS